MSEKQEIIHSLEYLLRLSGLSKAQQVDVLIDFITRAGDSWFISEEFLKWVLKGVDDAREPGHIRGYTLPALKGFRGVTSESEAQLKQIMETF